MKELLIISEEKISQLANFVRCANVTRFARRAMAKDGSNTVQVRDQEGITVFAADLQMVKMIEGGALGLYQELEPEMKKAAIDCLRNEENELH